MRSDLEKKICEHYRVPGVQIVLQGSYGTLKTIASALAHERQVVLIHDSGGAAQVLAEIIEPLLDREKELTREEMFRKREVKKRIDEYSVENEKSLALMQMLRESDGGSGGGKGRAGEMWETIEDICMHPELITTLLVCHERRAVSEEETVQVAVRSGDSPCDCPGVHARRRAR